MFTRKNNSNWWFRFKNSSGLKLVQQNLFIRKKMTKILMILQDLKDKTILDNIKFHSVENISEVLEIIFVD